MHSVLFVCTANICRSPMAEALLKAKVAPRDDWRIESAGTWAYRGDLVAGRTQRTLERRGLDASGHRSRSVDRELLGQFNLILVMEPGHKEALRTEFPEYASKIYLVSEMIGMAFALHDPINSRLEDFEETAQEFERIFSLGFERIAELSQD